MLPPELDRLATQLAKFFSILAWCAVGYTWLRYSDRLSVGGNSYTVVPVNLFSMVALISSFISLLCNASARDELDGPGKWLFLLRCVLPFVMIVSLLNPLGNRWGY